MDWILSWTAFCLGLNLSRISSVLLWAVSDLSMLIITKWYIHTATNIRSCSDLRQSEIIKCPVCTAGPRLIALCQQSIHMCLANRRLYRIIWTETLTLLIKLFNRILWWWQEPLSDPLILFVETRPRKLWHTIYDISFHVRFLTQGQHSAMNASFSWFPLFRTDKFPWLFQYFLTFLFLFKVWYHICTVFTITSWQISLTFPVFLSIFQCNFFWFFQYFE